MIITKMALPRRTFLRGLGTTLALPLLDSMFPAMSMLAASPLSSVRRLGYVYIPMGMNAARWTPAGEGAITELSPYLPSRKSRNTRIRGTRTQEKLSTARASMRGGTCPAPSTAAAATPARERAGPASRSTNSSATMKMATAHAKIDGCG